MPEHHHSKVLIVGAGPAGFTAAIYAARANLHPTLLGGLQPGGQLTITTDVENYPGFAEAIQGPWLMEQMEAQAKHVGTKIILDLAVKLDLARRPFVVTGDSGDTYSGDTVILATGAQARWLGLPSEETYRGFGVSACATCDGFFFRDKEVVVVGGGNTAVEEAIYLTNHASRVTLVHRRDTLRAEKILQDRLFRNPKIAVVWDSVVEEILGTPEPPEVTGARIRNLKTGAVSELACEGFFVAIGHTPVTEMVAGQLRLDSEGYILTRPDSTATDIPGVFAAGDVKDKIFRQAVTAAGMGCMAALEAEKFLAAQEDVAPARARGGIEEAAVPEDMAMDWDKLRVFHAVAEAGSFTHAGESLNLSQSAVSRQISALEESLSVPLFHRHARGLILTEQGELLFRTAREVFAKLAMAEGLISESKDRPKGPLKITTTVAFGSIWLTPRIREFLDLYPEIQVSLVVDDSELDLSMREADVAIRMTPPRQPDLIQRHLVSVQVHIYASTDYIQKHGAPQRAEELENHRIIVYGQDARPPVPGVNWLLDVGTRAGQDRQPILTVNNTYGMLRAIMSGLGLAALPDFVANEQNGLVRVLPEINGPPNEAYFVYPEELRTSKRISVFRDFLLRKVAEGRLGG